MYVVLDVAESELLAYMIPGLPCLGRTFMFFACLFTLQSIYGPMTDECDFHSEGRGAGRSQVRAGWSLVALVHAICLCRLTS